jgi:hypothetical protein
VQVVVMDTDLALVLGAVIAGLGILGALSALRERRTPRAPALTLVIAAGLLVYALTQKPGGYRFDQLPDVFFGVVGRFF